MISSLHRPWWPRGHRHILPKHNYTTKQQKQNTPVFLAEQQSTPAPARSQSTPVIIEVLDMEGKTLKQALSHQDPALVSRIVQAIPPCRRTRLHMDQLLSLMDLFHTMEIAIARIPAFIRKAPFMYQRDPVLHLLPKILFLETLGLHREHLQKLFLHYPYALYPSLEEIHAKIQFLKELSLSDHDLCTVILKSPMAFRLDTENHLQPRMSLLSQLGVSMSDIKQALLSNSRILSVQSDKLQKTVEFLHSLGLDYGSTVFSKAVLRCGPWNCELGFRNLLDAGFSESQVGTLFLRSPTILTKSRDIILSKVKYLVEVMQRDPYEVLKCPEYFQLSLEKRIRPRYEALELWKAQRQVEKKTYSLSYIFLPNDKAFTSQFPGIEVKINHMKC